jgi:hypothetical protein
MLYELIAGRRPFGGEDDADYQVLTEDPVPPSRIKQTVPRDLETICLKAMEKDPGRRYQTAAELAAD